MLKIAAFTRKRRKFLPCLQAKGRVMSCDSAVCRMYWSCKKKKQRKIQSFSSFSNKVHNFCWGFCWFLPRARGTRGQLPAAGLGRWPDGSEPGRTTKTMLLGWSLQSWAGILRWSPSFFWYWIFCSERSGGETRGWGCKRCRGPWFFFWGKGEKLGIKFYKIAIAVCFQLVVVEVAVSEEEEEDEAIYILDKMGRRQDIGPGLFSLFCGILLLASIKSHSKSPDLL